MQKFFRVYLPTKPYLCKYLQTIYGHPLVIDPQTDFGDIIITKLSSTLHCTLDKHDIDIRLNRLTDKLTIHMPIHWWYKLAIKEPTPHHIIRINRYFENMFEKDLHGVVHRASTWLNIPRQTAIEYFAENHGIELEKDITFEGLKKMEYRFRMQTPGAKITQKIVEGLATQMDLF